MRRADLPGRDRRAAREHQRRHDLRGAVVEQHARAARQRRLGRRQVAVLDVEDVGRDDLTRVREQVASDDVLDRDPGQVDRGALAGDRLVGGAAVDLDAAGARRQPARQHDDVVAGVDPPAPHRAGDDRAEALDREHAVDRQAQHAGGVARRDRARRGRERRAQRVEPGAGARRHRHDRRVGEERAGEVGAGLVAREREPLVVDRVGLGQRHDPGAHAEQLADVEVLAGLRHHALVRRDHQAHQVEAARAGDHRADEPLVAGHVDHRGAPAVELEVREPQLGGDPALLLHRQAVRVDPGQRQHERRLAVVDVPRGADDERRRGHDARARSSRLSTLPVGLRGSSSRNTTWRGRL
jgi:hypothetical protein